MDILKKVQKELKPWQEHNFPTRTWVNPYMGMVEELGELSHSLLKKMQGIRGTAEEHEAKAKDAVGDLLVFLCDFCNAKEWNASDILKETWDEVKKRDWQKNKVNGQS